MSILPNPNLVPSTYVHVYRPWVSFTDLCLKLGTVVALLHEFTHNRSLSSLPKFHGEPAGIAGHQRHSFYSQCACRQLGLNDWRRGGVVCMSLTWDGGSGRSCIRQTNGQSCSQPQARYTNYSMCVLASHPHETTWAKE